MLILGAGSLVVVMGFAALTVDIGYFAHTKRDLQNDADAMVLAAAVEMPNQAQANVKASEWGIKNEVGPNEIVSITFGTTCSGVQEPNTVTVRLLRTQPTFLARVLGITSGTMTACATAGRYSIGGFMGAAPWGIENDCIWGPDGTMDGVDDIALGETVTLKYDADNSGGECDAHTGNFGALAIDDSGAGNPCGDDPGADALRKYGDAICWGAISVLEIGDTVDTETGNIISRTRDSIEYLFANVSPECDTWEEIVLDGTLRAKCNPASEFYVGGPSIVKLIPVLDGLWEVSGGSEPVLIVDFVFIVLDPPPPGNNWCTGQSCDITAKFVEQAHVPAGIRRPFDENSSMTTVALID